MTQVGHIAYQPTRLDNTNTITPRPQFGIFLLEYAPSFFFSRIQAKKTHNYEEVKKVNKFCFDWSLFGQNRFVNMGYRTSQATSKNSCFSPSVPMLDILEECQSVAYIERNGRPCAPLKSVGNFLT